MAAVLVLAEFPVVGHPPLTMIPVKIDAQMMFTETWRRVRTRAGRMVCNIRI
jgi:hypothetical protein